MDFATFIRDRDYDFEIQDWFNDVFFNIYNNKGVIITKNVLKLIFSSDEYNMDNEGDLIRALVEYLRILNENHIFYTLIDSINNDWILNVYPHIGNEFNKWIILEQADFKKSLSYVNNSFARDEYFFLEFITADYKEYLATEKYNDMTQKLDKIEDKFKTLKEQLILLEKKHKAFFQYFKDY